MKNILITGAAGFLGSHLCERFLKEDFYVIGMDNFITGSQKNIDFLKKNKNFQFINHDVSKYVEINNELDYILHFASPASPIDYLNVGNIIIETDGKPIRTVGQLNNYINSVIRSGDKTIFITIYNNQNQKRSIGIKIE